MLARRDLLIKGLRIVADDLVLESSNDCATSGISIKLGPLPFLLLFYQ